MARQRQNDARRRSLTGGRKLWGREAGIRHCGPGDLEEVAVGAEEARPAEERAALIAETKHDSSVASAVEGVPMLGSGRFDPAPGGKPRV
jgi:hypothetical protein